MNRSIPVKMVCRIPVYQDGSNFYHTEHGHIATAPRRVWEAYGHDSMEAATACRTWFRDWCAERGTTPDFV